MKFLRKTATLLITVIFIAAFAIGIGVIFSVRNVNVSLLSYEFEADSKGAYDKISEIKQNILAECRGTVIMFVGEEDVLSHVDDGYVLDSFERVYPCTLNITLRQRIDTFAVEKGERYSVYDESGVYLFDCDSVINSIDEAPNIIVEGADNSSDINTIASVCALFKGRFSSLRSSVERVKLEKAQTALAQDKVIFVLRCGIIIEIQDYARYTAEKIGEAYREFSSLTGEQKLKGTIYCFEDLNGNIVRTYDQNT